MRSSKRRKFRRSISRFTHHRQLTQRQSKGSHLSLWSPGTWTNSRLIGQMTWRAYPRARQTGSSSWHRDFGTSLSILRRRRVCAGWGRQGPRPRRPGQTGRRRHPRASQNPARRGALLRKFFFGGGPCFCWEFWQKRVVGRGFLVVKLWWIAGESWEVDGQDSGSKNMPLFPGLFLRDSRFGNFVQPHPLYRVHCRMR